MATTTLESSMSSMSVHAESSTSAAILRNDDVLSQALRDGNTLDINDIARLKQVASTYHGALSSVGTSSTAVFSSRDESTVTKPTSTGTNYNKGKGKLNTGYSSSLSGTHGSASEAEVNSTTLRRDSLLAMGGWAASELDLPRPLRGAARAKERQQLHRKLKHKKPIVIIEQDHRAGGHLSKYSGTAFVTSPSCKGTGKKYLRHRTPKYDEDAVRLAEEGQRSNTTSHIEAETKSLSHTRVYTVVALVIVMLLTVAFSAFGAHTTGKARLPYTKVIVFIASASVACLTVITMLIARRALSEALLAGLLVFSFGFALLVELDDFM